MEWNLFLGISICLFSLFALGQCQAILWRRKKQVLCAGKNADLIPCSARSCFWYAKTHKFSTFYFLSGSTLWWWKS